MFYADVERDMIMEGNRCVFIFFNSFIMISPYKCGNGVGKRAGRVVFGDLVGILLL